MALTYTRYTRGWYSQKGRLAEGCTEDFVLQDDESDSAEMVVRWHGNISGLEDAPQITAYNDGWPLLFSPAGVALFTAIDTGDVSPDQFEEYLKAQGWQDVTQVKNPYAAR